MSFEPRTAHPSLLGVGAALSPNNGDLYVRQRDALRQAQEYADRSCPSFPVPPEAVEAAVRGYLRAMRESETAERAA